MVSCPAIELLESFQLGKLRGDQQRAFAEHLLDCPNCSTIVETMNVYDELTLALSAQQPPPTTNLSAPQLQKAIEFAMELNSEWI